MKKAFLLLSAALLIAVPFACNLNSLKADKVMVGTLLATPSIEIDGKVLAAQVLDTLDAGLDGSVIVNLDAGVSDAGIPDGGVDGGILANDKVTLPAQTTAFVFFGSRKSTALNDTPEGISGATVTVGADGAAKTTLKDDGKGAYNATSAESPSLVYAESKPFEFEAQYNGETYTGKVAKTPAIEKIAELHPPAGFVEHPVNTAFTFNRSSPEGSNRTLGFVTVIPIDQSGTRQPATYTNAPQTPLDFLQLVAAPSKWKATTVTIPGSAFAKKGQTYLVVFQSVELGSPSSDNLFAGSALLAGTSDVGVLRAQ